MDVVASPDTRWSDVLSTSNTEMGHQAPGPLWHAHRVSRGTPSELSMCTLFRFEGPFSSWEPPPGARCRRCEAEIDSFGRPAS
jgi:hypothetical protein